MLSEILLTISFSIGSGLYSKKEPSFVFGNDERLSLAEVVDTFGDFLLDRGVLPSKTSMENWGYIFDLDTNENDIFVDLVNDDGYFVINPSGRIKTYSFQCDVDSIWVADNLFLQGRTLLIQTGENYVEYNPVSSVSVPIIAPSNRSVTLGYPAIVEYGALGSYLYGRYGVSLTLSSYGKLTGMSSTAMSEGYSQGDESVFVANATPGFVTTEGNCALASMANVFSYYSHYGGKTLLPAYNSFTTDYPYNNPTLVAQAANVLNDYGNPYYPKSSAVSLHTIYAKLREYAINVGYAVNGIGDYETFYAVNNAAAYYGYTATISSYDTVPSQSASLLTQTTIIDEVTNGRAFQFVVLGDGYDIKNEYGEIIDHVVVYGGHGMMGTGYRIYEGTLWAGQIPIDVEIFCLSVYDGHSVTERWVDLDLLSLFPANSSSYRSILFAVNRVLLA